MTQPFKSQNKEQPSTYFVQDRSNDDIRYAFRTIHPFLAKWGSVPPEYDALYQRMCEELQQPDFSATWKLLTAWAVK